MHWHLDVSFDEDDTRIKNKEILENPAIINRIVLGILQLVKPTSFTNRSIKNIRNLIDYKPEKYITQIFSLLSKIKKEEEK